MSRVSVSENVDSDGCVTTTYTYYVTYCTMDGQTVEAKLGSGKSVDTNILSKSWDNDLGEGVKVRIKYLPEKPKYVIRIPNS